MISILLVDDHQILRQGLRKLLETESDFRVIGEAGDGAAGLDLLGSLRPDVLVIDMIMPGMTGAEVVRRMRMVSPETKAVVLSMNNHELYVLEALNAGASAYVLKDETAAELVRAIRQVVQGRRYFSPQLSERAIEAFLNRSREAQHDLYEDLSDREREVLILAAQGLKNPEIAARLAISPRTAETHRTNLMRKLGLQNQTDLIRFAIKRGIISLDL